MDDGYEFNEELRLFVHKAGECLGPHCVVHNQSDHCMRAFPLHWRGERKLFERICPHGVGHPDPDDLWYHVTVLQDDSAGVHGCDGCCHESSVMTEV